MKDSSLKAKDSLASCPNGCVRIFLAQGTFGYKSLRIIFGSLGAFMLLVSFSMITEEGLNSLSWTSYYILLSLGLLVYTLYYLSPKRAPRLEFFEGKIVVKPKMFAHTYTIFWSQVTRISYRPYQITFLLWGEKKHIVKIGTDNPEISRKIKRFVRQLAEANGVTVV